MKLEQFKEEVKTILEQQAANTVIKNNKPDTSYFDLEPIERIRELNSLKSLNHTLSVDFGLKIVDISQFGPTNYDYQLDKNDYSYNFINEDVVNDFYDKYQKEIETILKLHYTSFYYYEIEMPQEQNKPLNYDKQYLIDLAFTAILDNELIPHYKKMKYISDVRIIYKDELNYLENNPEEIYDNSGYIMDDLNESYPRDFIRDEDGEDFFVSENIENYLNNGEFIFVKYLGEEGEKIEFYKDLDCKDKIKELKIDDIDYGSKIEAEEFGLEVKDNEYEIGGIGR